jgi:LysR family hydrogen peroxide-inducible transcriptional activator
LQALRVTYEQLFPSCEIQLSSGDTAHTLQRLERNGVDCAILPLPINRDLWAVLQVAQSPLVLCMRTDDPLASKAQIDIHEAVSRITIFRDPELHPAAHSRLLEMFAEVGMPLNIANSAATPSDMQWMVKENYGLALIDQLSVLAAGLITRPIAGVNWTADTAFVTSKESTHIALPLLEKYLRENGLTPKRKHPRPEKARPQQLKLIG